MKKTLLALLTLISISASAASLHCEQTIENVVGTTAKYVELRNSLTDAIAVGQAQDTMFKAVSEAKDACK